MFFKKKEIKEETPLDLLSQYGIYYMEKTNYYNDTKDLNKYEKAFTFSYLFICEIGSDGYNGFIYHAGIYALDIIEALKEVGLNKYALDIESILKLFPNNKYEENSYNSEIENYCVGLEYDYDEIERAITNYISVNKKHLKN